MSFSRPIQWYHSHVDPIWLDATFEMNITCLIHQNNIVIAKAVNREDKRSRRYRGRDFAKFERSRRYRDR